MERLEERVYRTRVDSSGRIVLPSETRQRNQIATGDTVLVVETKDGLHVKSLDQAIAEAQAYYGSLAPQSRILSEELLAERRSQAERD